MTAAAVVVVAAMALICDAVLLNSTSFADLLQLASDFRFVEEVVVSRDQFEDYVKFHLHELPECPFASPLFACDGVFGEVTTLFLDFAHARLPTDNWLYHHWNFRGGPRFEFLDMRNFFGHCGVDWLVEYLFVLTRGVRKIHVRDSVLFTRDDRFYDSEFRSLLNASELTLTNVSFPTLVVGNTSLPLPKACTFVDVMLLCPVPRWIWRCFGNATVAPPCWSVRPSFVVPSDGKLIGITGGRQFSPSPGQTEFSIYTPLATTCDPPPVRNTTCALQREDSYRPAFGQRGTMTILYPLLGRGVGVTVADMYTSNLTTLLEVWDWETESYAVAVNRTAPRDSLFTRSVEQLPIPRVLTNRVRITFEYLIPTDSIFAVTLTRSVTLVGLPSFVPYRPACPAPITLNRRRSLDETVADSYCINRLCQFACPGVDDDMFLFGTPTSAEFVVIEGGVGWPSGELVDEPSDGTRVYRVNGTNITQLALPGVVGARSVRLVGRGGAIDTTVVRLPGQFLKTKQSSALLSSNLTSTDWRAAGSLAAPFSTTNASLAVVNGTTFVYAVTNNTLFRESSSGEWIDTQSSLTDLAVNLSVVMSRGVVRRLVAVDDRFLIVVGANVNERYDGSRGRDLIGRRVVATPIDVLDVLADRWTSALLNHGIECAMDEFDVISLDTRRFAVVKRDRTTAAVEFTWRPFDFALVECNIHADCNACLTNVGNIVDCRWCMLGGCTERNAVCQRGGASAIDVASCPAPTAPTVTETTSANATNATNLSSETSVESLSLTHSTGVVGASSPSPQATVAVPPASALTGLYVAIGVILGLVAVGVVGFLLWRRRNAREAGRREIDAVAMQDAPPKIASGTTEFDPKARYGEFGEDAEAEAVYDVGNFAPQQ